MKKKKCLWCGRIIELDRLGAVNTQNEPVIQWHLQPGPEGLRLPCPGSYTSIESQRRQK